MSEDDAMLLGRMLNHSVESGSSIPRLVLPLRIASHIAFTASGLMFDGGNYAPLDFQGKSLRVDEQGF
jgi:hypothetical protein